MGIVIKGTGMYVPERVLTNADLDNFYRTVAPLLDSFKRRKLQQVIAKLKAI